MRQSDRLSKIRLSPALAAGELARERSAAGRDVIALNGGQPDFDTPDHIKLAAAIAMMRGDTKYTPIAGSLALRSAIRDQARRDIGVEPRLGEIVVGNGAKQVIFNAFLATLDPGDEVLIPAPYWTSYPDMALVNLGTPVTIPCGGDTGYKLTPEVLERAMTPRTRWLVLNSPSNPSGVIYTRQEMAELGRVLLRHPEVMLLSDEIYQFLVFDGAEFVSMLQVCPELRDRTLVVNGVSKAYSMTGWRIGWGIGPEWLIKAITKAQSQSTSCAGSISQAAAVAALEGSREHLQRWNATFVERRNIAVRMLNDAPGLSCAMPSGAFYVYPSCAGVLGKRTPDGSVLRSDTDFCEFLIRTHDVAVVAGEAFGASPNFRISYALATERLQQACARIQAACLSLMT
jgi:aspartate aminotransferase